MDATGAGTSTGQSAGPTDVTGSAEDVTAGSSSTVGRADATGPLPVQKPADPTGPLPAQEADPRFGASADDTAAQPVVAATPSWFATGPLPLVPTPPGNTAPGNTAPLNTAPPAGAPAPPAAPAGSFDAGLTPGEPSTPPAGLFEPADGRPSTAVAPTVPHPAVPAPPPPNGATPVVEAHPPVGAVPPSQAVNGTSPGAAAPAPHGGSPTEPAPMTAPLPVVDPPPPPSPAHVPPPAAITPPAPGPPAQPAGLFIPPPPPAVASTATSPAPAPPTDLFTPATPSQGPAAPPAPEPPTGLFAAVAPPPTVTPAPAPSPPAGGVPASPVRPVDATGPMPVINRVSAPPPPDLTRPQAAGSPQPPARAPEAPPRTDARAFVPAPARPPRTDSPPDDRRRAAPSRPLPTPIGGGHSPSLTMVSGPKATTGTTTRRAWPLTLVGVLVAVAAGIALVFSVARTNPADLATSAAADAGSWPGARYQGAVAAVDGGEIRFDLTVTPDGASGTLSRDGGRATAELLWDQGGALIRANREWWLYHHPTRADDLAGNWVAEPLTETQEIDPLLRLSGPALSAYVRGEQPARWQAFEQQIVEGRSGIVLFDGARRVVVGSEDAHPLLAVDIAPNAQTPPVPVARPTDEELATVTGAAARVRQEAAPKTLAQMLLERPNVGIQLQPDPVCTAQTCNVTIVLTNSGNAPARGRLEVSADGQVVANHPLDVQPGQVATFTATAPNPQFGQPAAKGQIIWATRAVDD
jgi:hypothetical protein